MTEHKPDRTTEWTREQLEAITLPTGDLLVAAGAGSGKTRVLVERIIRKVVAGTEPLDLDRLLVVTFTNAAAAEMRQRIGKALEEAIKEQPDASHIRRQALLLDKASISTLHSFCAEVLHKYFYLKDLNPSYRILEEKEGDLLRQEILEATLEVYYDENEENSPFYRLAEAYSGSRGDAALQQLVLRLYFFSRSHPWPENWLDETACAFRLNGDDPGISSWHQIIASTALMEIENIISLLMAAGETAAAPGGPTPYLETISAELTAFKRLREEALKGWPAFFEAVHQATFDRLKPLKKDAYDPAPAERARELRDKAKKYFNNLKKECFSRSFEEQKEEIMTLAPLVEALVQLTGAFADRYREAKEEKGLLDFSDLEHHALALLSGPGSLPGQPVPSEAALDYRRRFQEVLVDEYQDTNEIQETILKLVSRGGSGTDGNLFMVGDVKQSIYRFRLTEPGLFLEKYRRFAAGGEGGRRIDLSRNFRSRRGVLAAVNYLFGQIMDEKVGEIEYDAKARLDYGAAFPALAAAAEEEGEFLLVSLEDTEGGSLGEEDIAAPDNDREEEAREEAVGSLLEGRLIALKIKELLGRNGSPRAYVYDKAKKEYRPINCRDIVILLRSTESYAPSFLEALKEAGLPAYAELNSGYFAAVEVEVILSLLKVIDNPYQDIPLAAVLRSPLFGFKGEDLAHLRLAAPRSPYYEAVKEYSASAAAAEDDDLPLKTAAFLERLEGWREKAREESLPDLVWRLYRETGYYDFVGGMPGGQQRQANLRALYERARQYEEGSFRGLFRFLKFIEKLQEGGGDLASARAAGEREDVIRIITVHKSKGLEFPVVFVAGLGKQFNKKDLYQDFLLHKDLGFGPRFIDTFQRVSYPTLPFTAVKAKLELEMLAEEMRILYVAMTRAEEKLYLVASVKNLPKEAKKWLPALTPGGGSLLPAFYRAKAKSCLDWLGPALLRHPEALTLRQAAGIDPVCVVEDKERSHWCFTMVSAGELLPLAAGAGEEEETTAKKEERARITLLKPVGAPGPDAPEVERRLTWKYPCALSPFHRAKLTVSEIKSRRLEEEGEPYPFAGGGEKQPPFRPRFLGREGLKSAERGTAYHFVMQHLDWDRGILPSEAEIKAKLTAMAAAGQIEAQAYRAINPRQIVSFFRTPLGRRLAAAPEVYRELSFSLVLPAEEVYPHWREEALPGEKGEEVLVQGVIDCLFREEKGGLILLDYKTDRTAGVEAEKLADRYREQINLYARAVQAAWQEEVAEKYLYYFNGSLMLKL